jgi:hypothetical protein
VLQAYRLAVILKSDRSKCTIVAATVQKLSVLNRNSNSLMKLYSRECKS